MTGAALTLPGFETLLLRAQERPVRFLPQGTRVMNVVTRARGTVVGTAHREAWDGKPGWRFVLVDVDTHRGVRLDFPYRTGWLDQLVEEDTDR